MLKQSTSDDRQKNAEWGNANGIYYTLTDEEIDLCKTYADLRIADSKQRNLKNNRGCKGLSYEQEVFSFVGEVVAAKKIGLSPQLFPQLSIQQDITKTPDLVVYKEAEAISIDVKTSYNSPYLYISNNHISDVDYFFYVTGSQEQSCLVGYISSDRAKTYPIQDPGNRNAPCYVVPISGLSIFKKP